MNTNEKNINHEDGLNKCSGCNGYSWNDSNLCSSCGGGYYKPSLFEKGGALGFTRYEFLNDLMFFILLPFFLTHQMVNIDNNDLKSNSNEKYKIKK